MTRLSFRYWLISLLLGPACALAMEVGEIQVQSALNQLFDATIPLPTLTPEDLNRISVKVAAPPMFAEFGLDRTATLANLVFSIQYDAEGRVYVKVVSTQPIREPSLALLLEFGWPRGKTFREFTVLLDPVKRLTQRPANRTKTVLNEPAATTAPPAAIAALPAAAPETPAMPPAAPVTVAVAAAPEVRTPTATPLPVEAARATPTYRPSEMYGPVAPGEGLWKVALKIRPEGITRDQMMQALFRANPQAFSSAGIDSLKIGAQLRIPTYREIADFTGSSIARRLAILEEHPAIPVATDQPPPAKPEAFPLGIIPVPEPVAITDTPSPHPAPAAPPGPDSLPPPVAAVVKQEHPKGLQPARPPIAHAEQAASATPLLSVAVSDIMADVARLSGVVTQKPLTPALSATEPPKPTAAPPAPAPVPVKKTPIAESAPAAPPAPAPVGKPPIAESAPAAPPAPAPIEKSSVTEPSVAAKAPATTTAPPQKSYKGGDEYGPVSSNERLWDIAAKVRPDPSMGLDIMMKALFLANPKSFSKPTMDHLKIGSTLRVPTLQEIVQHTGSNTAKNLLEQQGPVESTKTNPETAPGH